MASMQTTFCFLKISRNLPVLFVNGIHCSAVRRYRFPNRYVAKELYRRRVIEGPVPEVHRSTKLNWNYDAELYSFGKRLGEEFKGETIRQVFVHKSYLEQEHERRASLGVEDITLTDNSALKEKGHDLAGEYISVYLRNVYPKLPEEGVSAIKDYLLSERLLSHVSTHLGVSDLILCSDFPPTPATCSDTLLAVIGAIDHDQGRERAQLFVQDFIISMLASKDVHTLWAIQNPMGLLATLLESQGRAPPEPRLMYSAGSNTIMAAYIVGVYSDRKLIGKSAGETQLIAEEMAARDSLRNLFDLNLHRSPLPLGQKGHDLELDWKKRNVSVADLGGIV